MKYLKIFTDFLEVMSPLTDEEAGRLCRAMLSYTRDGVEPELPGNERFLWIMARQHLDRERDTYEDKVKHLRRGRASVSEKAASVSEKTASVSETAGPVSEKAASVSEEDKDKEKDKDKDKDKDSLSPLGAAGRERRPTLAEVIRFCQERGLAVDPQYFFSYYEANGWHIGKQPIRDWQAALVAWARRSPPKKSDRDVFREAMALHRAKEAKDV